MVTPSERVFKLWQSISPDWCDQSPNSLQNIVPGCFSFDLILQSLKFVHCMMRKCTFYFDLCNFHQRTVSRKLRDFLMFSIDKDFHGLLSNRIVQRSVAYEEKEIYEHQISNFMKSISFLETVL